MMQGLTRYNMRIVAEVMSGNSYDFQLLDLLGDAPVIVDCGANIGSFSLACMTLKPACKLIAIEPDKTLFEAMKANLRSYSTISLVQAALTNRNGTVSLKSGKKDGVANSIFSGEMVSEQSAFDVDSRAICEFLHDVIKIHGGMDVLKLDIEGGEWYLLDAPADLLAHVGVIYLEYHSADFFPRFCAKLEATHFIYDARIRFPHRGEVAWIRKDLLSEDQRIFEIKPPP